MRQGERECNQARRRATATGGNQRRAADRRTSPCIHPHGDLNPIAHTHGRITASRIHPPIQQIRDLLFFSRCSTYYIEIAIILPRRAGEFQSVRPVHFDGIINLETATTLPPSRAGVARSESEDEETEEAG